MQFIKCSQNPILSLGEPGEWDDHNIGFPMVIKDDRRYLMYYCGGQNQKDPEIGGYANYQLGVAVSTDGIHFEKSKENPVLPLGKRDNLHAVPAILRDVKGGFLKEDDIIKMWFNGNRANDIELAFSKDGISWEKYKNNPVFSGGYAPTVIKDGSLYKMWYVVGHFPDFRIGYAESHDGIHWKGDVARPIMAPECEWEGAGLCYPFVIKLKDQYVMFYSSMPLPHTEIGIAYGPDGISWPASKRHLLLKHGKPGEWDGVYAGGPCFLQGEAGEEDRLYYMGRIDTIHKYYAIGGAISSWKRSL